MGKELKPAEDLTGRVFGRLTVMYRCEYSMCGAVWHCRCACGNETDARGTQLRNGSKKSCGCIRRKEECYV